MVSLILLFNYFSNKLKTIIVFFMKKQPFKSSQKSMIKIEPLLPTLSCLVFPQDGSDEVARL